MVFDQFKKEGRELKEEKRIFNDLKKIQETLQQEVLLSKGSPHPELAQEDGSCLTPFASLTDSFKFVNDLAQKLENKESVSVCIDFSARDYYVEGKYSFLGKKDMPREEYEESLVKFILERKNLAYLIDPFVIADSSSYQKFYQKLKEKKVHKVRVGTKYFEEIGEDFKQLRREDFPKLKDDQFAEISKDVFDFNFHLIDLVKYFNFSKIIDLSSDASEQGKRVFLQNLPNTQFDHFQSFVGHLNVN